MAEGMSADDLKTARAMAALDQIAADWARRVNLDRMATLIAGEDDRESRITMLVKQGYGEGYYQAFCDAKDGKFPSIVGRQKPVVDASELLAAALYWHDRTRYDADRHQLYLAFGPSLALWKATDDYKAAAAGLMPDANTECDAEREVAEQIMARRAQIQERGDG